MRYFALIGDLVSSRVLNDRAEVQKRFQHAIQSVTDTSSDDLVAPLKLTAGDEVQGLTTNPHVVVGVITHVSEALIPVRISWGLGFGDLATELVDDVALLDGPCFHRAREAVQSAKKKSNSLEVRGLEAPVGEMLAAIMNLIGAIRSSWTPKQAEAVAAARGKSQVAAAESLGIDPSTISRTLSAAHYKPVLEGEAAARALLRKLAPLGPGQGHISASPEPVVDDS